MPNERCVCMCTPLLWQTYFMNYEGHFLKNIRSDAILRVISQFHSSSWLLINSQEENKMGRIKHLQSQTAKWDKHLAGVGWVEKQTHTDHT